MFSAGPRIGASIRGLGKMLCDMGGNGYYSVALGESSRGAEEEGRRLTMGLVRERLSVTGDAILLLLGILSNLL